MSRPQRVRIVEVGPRDGLQNEPKVLSPQQRARFVDQLVRAGVQHIEVGSFVSPKRVPQMADTGEVFSHLTPSANGTVYAALTPNRQGLDAALRAGANEVAVFAAASDSFSTMNLGCSIDESLPKFEEVVREALARDLRVRGYVSVVADCPYEGHVKPEAVERVAHQLLDMGCYEVSLGDTVGRGNPDSIARLLDHMLKTIKSEQLAVHLHDTYGLALANVVAALDRGIATIDSSAGGLGGCPHAPGAAGNLATEDLIWLLDSLKIEHGLNLDGVIAAVKPVLETLEVVSPSRVHRLHTGFAGEILKP